MPQNDPHCKCTVEGQTCLRMNLAFRTLTLPLEHFQDHNLQHFVNIIVRSVFLAVKGLTKSLGCCSIFYGLCLKIYFMSQLCSLERFCSSAYNTYTTWKHQINHFPSSNRYAFYFCDDYSVDNLCCGIGHSLKFHCDTSLK